MDPAQILAFRLARSGLTHRAAQSLAGAAACPAPDSNRDGALLALAARMDGLTRARYDAAVDAGEIVVAYALRGTIHALAPGDHALFGRALIAEDDDELARQIGPAFRRLVAEKGLRPTAALAEVAAATAEALGDGRALDKNELHEALRRRVHADLMPWCAGCGSHHVAPMLWRYGTVQAGVRLDARRRYVLDPPAGPPPDATQAVRRYLGWSAPARSPDFAAWAGLAPTHAARLWAGAAGDLAEVPVGARSRAFALRADVPALASPPAAHGVRLLPPGDPYLQVANRPLLAPDPAVRSRLFRAAASPGIVLQDGTLAGLWRARVAGTETVVTVEALGRLDPAPLDAEAGRLAGLRGVTVARVTVT